MSATVQEIINIVEGFAPKSLAVDGDPIGLTVGDTNAVVTRVMTTLDVTEQVVDEAVENGVNMIVAHHPLLFVPLQAIDVNTPKGKIVHKCLTNNISVYSAHTNLDIAEGGVNDWLAEKLGIEDTEVLVPTESEKLYKLVAFVPSEDAEKVRDAIGDAGAGHIGNYSHCSFSAAGTGSFLPGDETNPHIGQQGVKTKVDEERIETIVPEPLRKAVIQALHRAHPYEEVAYDLYPLALDGKALGLGRIGKLREQTTLKRFLEEMKETFTIDGLRYVGELDKPIETVAVLGGDGNNYWKNAKQKGADVYVTGDLKFHNAQDAQIEGLALVDPGHHVEEVMKHGLLEVLQNEAEKRGLVIEVIDSKLNTDPFSFL